MRCVKNIAEWENKVVNDQYGGHNIEIIPSKKTKMWHAFQIVHKQGRGSAELNKQKGAIKLTQ